MELTQYLPGTIRLADTTSLPLDQVSLCSLLPPMTSNIVQQPNRLLQKTTPKCCPGGREFIAVHLGPVFSLNPFTLYMFANMLLVQTFSSLTTFHSTSIDIASSISSILWLFRPQPHWLHSCITSTKLGQTLTWLSILNDFP